MAVTKGMKSWIAVLFFVLLVFTGCGNQTDSVESPKNVADTDGDIADKDIVSTERQNSSEESGNETDKKGDESSMQLTINGTEYEVELDENITTNEIVKKMPLDLTLVRYAGHEYYSELPFTPEFAKETTSNIKAGHVYYWDGWNAFVINYEECDISPYRVVHIGEIKSKDVSEMLRNADEKISVSVLAE